MKTISTRLKYVFSKDPETIIEWVNALPFKIEIKGNPILKKDKFYLFFVLPDDITAIFTGDLDG